MRAACNHDHTVECCRNCCRLCFEESQDVLNGWHTILRRVLRYLRLTPERY